MPYRTTPFVTGEIYHVFNRSIAKQPIFITQRDFKRTIDMIGFYQFHKPPVKFSYYQSLSISRREQIDLKNNDKGVDVVSFCIMPNHYHFLLKQLKKDGIKNFVSNIQNSYSKYFNIKRERTGSLFQAMFKGVHVATTEQLIHVSRYIHLNPSTSFIVHKENLLEYPWSSYKQYLFDHLIFEFVNPGVVLENFKDKQSYKTFTEDQVDYQRELVQIKHLIFD